MSSVKPAKENRRERIRRAAYECFRDHGYYPSTVDMVCRGAGVSKGSFYWYFSSKQEVFIDILETWTQEVVEQMRQQFKNVGVSEDPVGTICQSLMRESRRGRAIVNMWVEFTAAAAREPEVKDALRRFHKNIRETVTEILRPVFSDRLSETDLKAVSAAIFAAYSGLLVQDMADSESGEVIEALTHLMHALRQWAPA